MKRLSSVLLWLIVGFIIFPTISNAWYDATNGIYYDNFNDSDHSNNPTWINTSSKAWLVKPQNATPRGATQNFLLLNDTTHGQITENWTKTANFILWGTPQTNVWDWFFYCQYNTGGTLLSPRNCYGIGGVGAGSPYREIFIKSCGTDCANTFYRLATYTFPSLSLKDIITIKVIKKQNTFNATIFRNGTYITSLVATNSTYTGSPSKAHMVVKIYDQIYISFKNATWSNKTSFVGGAPAITTSLVLYDTNITNRNVKKTLFGEGEDLFQYANHTLSNGTILANSNCTVKFPNALLEYSGSDTDYTLCTSGCDFTSYSYNFTKLKTNSEVIYDRLYFDACHVSNVGEDLKITFCGQSFTIPKTDFPLCSLGTNLIAINSSACKTKNYAYATLTNSAPLVKAHRIRNERLDRKFATEYQNMVYNSTSKVYRSNLSVEYYSHGAYNINVTCINPNSAYNKVNSQKSITIVNKAPSIVFNQVVTPTTIYNISNAMKIQYSAGIWKWYATVLDDDVKNVTYKFYNVSKKVIYSNFSLLKTKPINISSIKFVDFSQQPFNFSVLAFDVLGNRTFKSITFTVNDTGLPVCINNGKTQQQNGTAYYFNYSCSDDYFFSFNISCNNGFKNYKQDINGQSYSFINQTSLTSYPTDLSCDVLFCDAHTLNSIGDMVVTKTANSINFDGIPIRVTDAVIKDFTYTKLSDRYTFCIEPADTQISYFNIEIPYGCHAVKSKWQGHLVCPEKRIWIDFVNPLAKTVSIGENTLTVDLSLVKDRSTVCFNSIGKFNCVNRTDIVDITEAPVNSSSRLTVGYCPDTTPSAILVVGFIFFALFFIVLAIWTKASIFGWLSSFIIIGLSWVLVDCMHTIGYMIGGIGIMLLAYFVIGTFRT